MAIPYHLTDKGLAATRPEGREPFGDWMQTFTGKAFYPADPIKMLHDDKIDPVDIAHALSMTCRYGGHVSRFYSVAEHSLLVSLYCDPADALDGLLHDATEAYMQDLVRPVKNMLPEYKAMEERLMTAIAIRFGLRTALHGHPDQGAATDYYLMPDSVKEADNRILLDERRHLLGPVPQPWHPSIEAMRPLDCTDEWLRTLGSGKPAAGWDFGCTPHLAKALWLQRFGELTGGKL